MFLLTVVISMIGSSNFANSLPSTTHQIRKLAALGRPLYVGVLYDAINDVVVPGLSLWNAGTLASQVAKFPQFSTNYNLASTGTIDDKFFSLEVQAELRITVMSGKLAIKGSAGFLMDDVDIDRTTKVALVYKTTKDYLEVPMNMLVLSGLDYPDVLQSKSATHVVTGVQYGANAVFELDSKEKEQSDTLSINGGIDAKLDLVELKFGIGGSFTLTEKLKDRKSDMVVTYKGDILINPNPRTLNESLQVYANLPKLIDNNEIPVTVWLTPLAILSTDAVKLVAQISETLVDLVEKLSDQFSKAKGRLLEIKRRKSPYHFAELHDDMLKFDGRTKGYWAYLQSRLAELLPKIRGKGDSEAELLQLIKRVGTSPFSAPEISKWLDKLDTISEALDVYIENIWTPPVTMATDPAKFYGVVNDIDRDFVVVFMFSVFANTEDPYLKAMAACLNNITSYKYQFDHSIDNKTMWYKNVSEIAKATANARVFVDFAKANVNDSSLSFAFAQRQMSNETKYTYESGTIYLFEDTASRRYRLSTPIKIYNMTVNGRHVKLIWKEPKLQKDMIESYTIEILNLNSTYKEWEFVKTVASKETHTDFDVRSSGTYTVGVSGKLVDFGVTKRAVGNVTIA